MSQVRIYGTDTTVLGLLLHFQPQQKLFSITAVIFFFTLFPLVEVPKGESKPYLLTLNGEVIFDIAVHSKPIVFSTHKFFGEPNEEWINDVDAKVMAALLSA